MTTSLGAIDLAGIRAAAAAIAGRVVVSPCVAAERLSRLTGCTIWCKLDLFQATGSFKERGACNRLLQLNADERGRGVIAASAGNHAQALAYHGRALGIPVCVVMPTTAPLVKVANCRAMGAQVIVHGPDFAAAVVEARRLSSADGSLLIHAYDDPGVIAGQGTIGLELLEQVPDLEAVLIPLGGGGLAAGVATVIRALKPKVQIFGVEPAAIAKASAALAAGHPVPARGGLTLADGLAVPETGALALTALRATLDGVIEVSEDSIATAILRLLELEKIVVEGAGAVPLAALLDDHPIATTLRGTSVALLLCGGNIDPGVLGRIIERGLARDGRLARISIEVRDRPGQLAAALGAVAQSGANVKEIHHDRAFATHDPAAVAITLVLETRDHDHQREVVAGLTASGVTAQLI